ncbi:hypothetical protein [Lysobacter capsici]|uniref:hypothetical protein n=1 Tax=Lysobacter capsici TaxID=435897 RepID=UPI00287BBD74|nr:hypothetical protein [Lysobacter capsici]WND82362.1 hypothetical protein RJ610_08405 [Lysobacter capsici]WND87558.1 hypothetical protein RJ609_08410 [Lysobacter capsici]
MAWTLWHFAFPEAAALGVAFMVLAFKYGMHVHASATLARLRPLPRQRLQLPGTVYCNVSIERGDCRDCFEDARFVLRGANGAELGQYGKWLRVRYNHRPPSDRVVTSFITPDDGVFELSIENAAPEAETATWVVIQRDVEPVVAMWVALGITGAAMAMFGSAFAAMLWSSSLLQSGAAGG